MEGGSQDAGVSRVVIPSSDIVPPPPVNYDLSKNQSIRISSGETSIRETRRSSQGTGSEVITQNEGSENFPLANSAEHDAVLLTREPSFDTPLSSFGCIAMSDQPAPMSIPDLIIEEGENADPVHQPSRFQCLTKPVRASVPLPLSSSKRDCSALSVLRVNSIENVASGSSKNSHNSGSGTAGTVASTTTTSSASHRTTRSGSDLFKSDASSTTSLHKPIKMPLQRWRRSIDIPAGSVQENGEQGDSLPVLAFTLSLSVTRNSSSNVVGRGDQIEFKTPAFTDAITWQSWVRRSSQAAPNAISEAAVVLSNSFSDWMRRVLPSDSESSHSDSHGTGRLGPTGRVTTSSSASSEYFIPSKKAKITISATGSKESDVQGTTASTTITPSKAKPNASQNTPVIESLSPSFIAQVTPMVEKTLGTNGNTVAESASVISESASEVNDSPTALLDKDVIAGTPDVEIVPLATTPVETNVEPVHLNEPAYVGGEERTGESLIKSGDRMSTGECLSWIGGTEEVISGTPLEEDGARKRGSHAETVSHAEVSHSPQLTVTLTDPSENRTTPKKSVETVTTEAVVKSKKKADELTTREATSPSFQQPCSPPSSCTPVCDSLMKLPTTTTTTISRGVQTTEVDEDAGLYVYAKWPGNSFYYSGKIVEKLPGGKCSIMFDDGSVETISYNNIALTDVLPISTNVYVDVEKADNFLSGFVVVGHVRGTTPPSYIVKRLSDGEVNQVACGQVAISSYRLRSLYACNQLTTAASWLDEGAESHTTTPAAAKRPSSRKLALSDLDSSSSSLLTWKRIMSRRRDLTEATGLEDDDGAGEEEGPLKTPPRRRTKARRAVPRRTGRRATTTTSAAAAAVSSSRLTRSAIKASPDNPSNGPKAKRSRHHTVNRRNSQMWAIGRRIVAQASRTSRRFSRSPESLLCKPSSPPPPQDKGDSVLSMMIKEEQVDEETETSYYSARESACVAGREEEGEEGPTDTTPPDAPPVCTKKELIDVDAPPALMDDSALLQALCAEKGLPMPHANLFSHWCVLVTMGFRCGYRPSHPIYSSDCNVEALLSMTENDQFLQGLVVAGGGTKLTSLDAELISSSGHLLPTRAEPASSPHVAMVSPGPKRTVKFLQGLATLGRVPLLSPLWLFDACLLAAGKRPLLTPPHVLEEIARLQLKPQDIPLALLRSSPRDIYELPRGVSRLTKETVPPTVVPPYFLGVTRGGRALPVQKTLLAQGGFTEARIVAVVTEDARGFGAGWLEILRHALAAPAAASPASAPAHPPALVPTSHCIDRLSAWQANEGLATDDLKIVLVDKAHRHRSVVEELQATGFVVVNMEFLIQCLINGAMLDLELGTIWN